MNPALPEWLEPLLNQPWTPEASLAVDRWIAYVEAEFSIIPKFGIFGGEQ